MEYTYKKLSELRGEILQALGDSEGVFYLSAEIDSNIKEGLEFLNSIIHYQKQQINFSVPQDSVFLNLLDTTTIKDSIVLSKTVSSFITDLKRTLILEVDEVTPKIFSLDNIEQVVEAKINELISSLGLICKITQYPLTTSPVIDRFEFPENFSSLRRLEFIYKNAKDETTRRLLLEATEEQIAAFYNTQSINPANSPIYYVENSLQKNIIKLVPPVNQIGTLETISSFFQDIETELIIQLPNNLVWILKYAVLAELFNQEGDGYDPNRGKYCFGRLEQGIIIARNCPLILDIKVNGLPLSISGAVFDLDRFDNNWFLKSGKPLALHSLSWNIITFGRKLKEVYAIEASILSNTILPALDEDYLQIPEEYYQILKDYIYHISLLKLGGDEFFSTIPLFENVLKQAVKNNRKLDLIFKSIESAKNKYKREKIKNPIEEEDLQLANETV